MTKTKRLLSVILVVLMTLSLLSSFSVSVVAADPDLDKFIYSPMQPISNPGYGVAVPSGIIFVASSFASAKDNEWVFMDFNGEVYKAVKGVNAFSDIQVALNTAGKSNINIKIGPGVYSEDVTLNYNGLKLYGNYAGVNPNVDTAVEYVKDLNPVRDAALESTISEAKWTWTTKSNNIIMDGFKVTNQGGTIESVVQSFLIAVSGTTSEYFSFYNNIVENCTGTVIDANRGYSTGVYIKNNRITNCSGSSASAAFFIGGGSMCDSVVENNYFANNTCTLNYYTSCGANGSEAFISFSNNVVNNCARGVDFHYDNSNFGANLDYKRVVGNVFYNSGSTQGSIVKAYYLLEYIKSGETDPIACTDTGSKTFISENKFYDIASGIVAIDLVGGGNLTGSDANYVLSCIENKFIFASASNNTAIKSTVEGTIDASRNYYGTESKMISVDDVISKTEATRLISMPYYTDAEMTTLSGGIELKAGNRRRVSVYFDADQFNIDNVKTVITTVANDGLETVDFTNCITASNAEYQIYTDFLLRNEVNALQVDLTGEITRAYLVATDTETGMATRYDLIIKTTLDAEELKKCDIRYLIDDSTVKPYVNYTLDDTDIEVGVLEKYIYFPFSLTLSPAATYKLYTDKACKTEYKDPTFYLEPDKDLNLYAKVTAGNGVDYKVYTITLNRKGTSNYDSRILRVLNPEANVQLFNNERKSVVYRPYALTDKVTFDFEVTPNATYKIYKNYDKATGKLSNEVSAMGNVKELAVADAISYYYVEVTSEFGYSQVYTITMYNDVKSTDNVIKGIDGMKVDIIDNVIYIKADPTLTSITAHFDVDPFADVKVYADEAKTFAAEPSSTYDFINNREVEIRNFQLGILNRVSYFYVDVTSEIGEMNSYKVIITKDAEAVSFTDIDSHWSKDYVKDIANLGVITGYLDTAKGTYSFKPNNNATRQEVAVLFLRMMGIDPTTFKNAMISSVFTDTNDMPEWSYNSIKGVYSLGIMQGKTNKDGKMVFDYASKITRQEFFQALANLLQLDTDAAADVDLSKFKDGNKVAKWAQAATKAVIKAGIIEGSNGYLNPTANITRGEIAKIISIVNIVKPALENK